MNTSANDYQEMIKEINQSKLRFNNTVSLEIEKKRAYLDGVNDALRDVERTLNTMRLNNVYNNEDPDAAKQSLDYEDGVKDTLYELAKELDVPSQDIRDHLTSVDDACAELAKRIKEAFQKKS